MTILSKACKPHNFESHNPHKKINDIVLRISCQSVIILVLSLSIVTGILPCYYREFLLQLKESTT